MSEQETGNPQTFNDDILQEFLGFDVSSPEGLRKQIELLNRIINEKLLTREILGDQYDSVSKAMEHREEMQQVIKLLLKGCPVKDVLGMTNEHIEAIYGYGYQLYANGKYDEAIEIFKNLVVIDVSNYKCSFALAAAHQQKKSFLKAAQLYVIASIINPADPLPFYYSSECYLELNDTMSAIISLEEAIKKAKKDPQYAALGKRCKLIQDTLKEELAKALAPKNKAKKKKKKKE
jgi:type III secretion system low calcium response chaperone LcrH/SycD